MGRPGGSSTVITPSGLASAEIKPQHPSPPLPELFQRIVALLRYLHDREVRHLSLDLAKVMLTATSQDSLPMGSLATYHLEQFFPRLQVGALRDAPPRTEFPQGPAARPAPHRRRKPCTIRPASRRAAIRANVSSIGHGVNRSRTRLIRRPPSCHPLPGSD